MKKVVAVGLLFVVVGVVGLWWWGRAAIYPVGTDDGLYGGEGIMTIFRKGQYMIEPEGAVPFFAEDSYQASKYEGAGNKIIPIPDREELVYAVGRVRGWEEIAGSSDQYLLLYHREQDRVERYRVALEESELYGQQPTLIYREKIWGAGEKRKIGARQYSNKNTAEMGESALKALLWRGDTVVVLPLAEYTEQSKRDENGVYLAGKLVIRRIGYSQGEGE